MHLKYLLIHDLLKIYIPTVYDMSKKGSISGILGDFGTFFGYFGPKTDQESFWAKQKKSSKNSPNDTGGTLGMECLWHTVDDANMLWCFSEGDVFYKTIHKTSSRYSFALKLHKRSYFKIHLKNILRICAQFL